MSRQPVLPRLLRKTDEDRRRRRERSARWAAAPATRRDRVEAWASLTLADHGFVRLLYRNRHQVTDDLWRSAQPAPADIAWAARQGIRTVVTLRKGTTFGSHALEVEACAAAGLAFVASPFYSREPPRLVAIERFAEVIEGISYPALVHCKSGADRAGLAAAMFLLIREERTVAEAGRQLGLGYGHVRWGRTGVLDHFLECYREEGEANGIPFLEWARTAYDRERVMATFTSRRWADVLVDRVLKRE